MATEKLIILCSPFQRTKQTQTCEPLLLLLGGVALGQSLLRSTAVFTFTRLLQVRRGLLSTARSPAGLLSSITAISWVWAVLVLQVVALALLLDQPFPLGLIAPLRITPILAAVAVAAALTVKRMVPLAAAAALVVVTGVLAVALVVRAVIRALLVLMARLTTIVTIL
jgi:hypothetical protein